MLDINANFRTAIVDELYARIGPQFRAEFESKYKASITETASKSAKAEFEAIVERQKAEIEDLRSQLRQKSALIEMNASEAMIDSQSTESIQLSSDIEEVAFNEEIVLSSSEPASATPITDSSRYAAPGLPETSAKCIPDERQQTYHVIRMDADTLYSESFVKKTYFVHISPNCKYLVVRPHAYGEVTAEGGKIKIKGLAEMSQFDVPKELTSQWNMKYGGLLIFL